MPVRLICVCIPVFAGSEKCQGLEVRNHSYEEEAEFEFAVKNGWNLLISTACLLPRLLQNTLQEPFGHPDRNGVEVAVQSQGGSLLSALIPVSLFSRKRQQTSPIGVPPYGQPCTVLLDDQFFSAARSVTWLTCWVLLGHYAFLALSRASRIQPIIQIRQKR